MHAESHAAVLVSAARTPVGKFQGALSSFSATALGSIVVREAVSRAAIDPAAVNECLMGCVLTAGLGQNPARQAALRGGLADSVSATTLDMVCGSGLQAIALAAQSIAASNSEIVVAGGMESMSNAPYLLPHARRGFRLGDSNVVDSIIHDGLWCAYEDAHMGNAAELVAEKYSITRAEQDAYALESHRRAVDATRSGRFAVEIASVILPENPSARRSDATPTVISRDESIRDDAFDHPDAALAALATLRPAFKPDGTVTAGNSPGLNDAAAAIVVMSAARAAALGITPLATIPRRPPPGSRPRGS